MKLTPLAQGTGVPAQSDSSLGKTADSSKMARAKAIASGQEPAPASDPQVEKTQNAMKKIKMRTNASTNRHETPAEVAPEVEEIPTPDVVEEASETEETRPLSPQFAALAKAKRAIQVKEMELAKREEALKTQAPVDKSQYISKEDLKANPLMIFDYGVTHDQLAEAIINGQSAPLDPVKLRNEIKEELKKEFLGEFSSRDQQQEQQVLAEIKREAMALTSDGEQFEAINAAKAHDHVVNLIHRTWKETGEVMDVSEAAQLVEEQLIEEALPFAKIKKLQSRLTPEPVAPTAQTPVNPNTKIMRTLTNRDSASPTMDRRARAIAAMMGTLKRG